MLKSLYGDYILPLFFFSPPPQIASTVSMLFLFFLFVYLFIF